MTIPIILFFAIGLLCADEFPKVYNSESNKKKGPISPEAAAKSYQLPKGFKVTVFAAEPELRNPIAMAWDVKKRMWVAENYTYAEKGKRFDLSLRDRIVIFEDEDRDGKAEKRKVFTDKLQMPTLTRSSRVQVAPTIIFSRSSIVMNSARCRSWVDLEQVIPSEFVLLMVIV
ncbi:hypothetical protein OAK95_03005 [Akkermansiaceae bacterium]|nr:hypothetical protein [Akkermansiaceae bacterium]